MTALLLFAILSITASFICSVLEAVLLSVTPTFVKRAVSENRSYAKRLEVFKDDIDKPLITILSFNTIAHTVGAIGVGATAEQAFGSSTVGIVSAIMTALILVVSEIIPKTLGATYWQQLVGVTVRVLQLMMLPVKYTGLLWFLQLTTRLISKNASLESVSKEDLEVMADMAEKYGVIQDNENVFIRNLLRFSEVSAKDIMTPRVVMVIADANNSIIEFYQSQKTFNFSRIPIYENDSEYITGFVLKDELLEAMVDQQQEKKLIEFKREILMTDEDQAIPELFQQFIDKKSHMSLVVDEYGSIVGLVTMEDVIETLLGLEIIDESDHCEDLQAFARKQWERRAKRMGISLEEERLVDSH